MSEDFPKPPQEQDGVQHLEEGVHHDLQEQAAEGSEADNRPHAEVPEFPAGTFAEDTADNVGEQTEDEPAEHRPRQSGWRLPKDVAWEVAHAGKPERDTAYNLEEAVSVVRQFVEEAEKRVISARSIDKAKPEAEGESTWDLEKERTSTEDRTKDELDEAATDLILQNAAVRQLLKESGGVHSSYWEKYEKTLVNPDKFVEEEVAEGSDRKRAERIVARERQELKSQARQILQDVLDGPNPFSPVRKSTETIIGEHLESAEKEEQIAQVLVENPEVVSDIKKMLEDYNGIPLERDITTDAVRNITSNTAKLEHRRWEWSRYSSSKELAQTGEDVVQTIGYNIREIFGEKSEVRAGWKELQQSDDTTIGQLKAYYDKAISDRTDPIDARLKLLHEGMDSYFKALDKVKGVSTEVPEAKSA